jgi:hypothetical protein
MLVTIIKFPCLVNLGSYYSLSSTNRGTEAQRGEVIFPSTLLHLALKLSQWTWTG